MPNTIHSKFKFSYIGPKVSFFSKIVFSKIIFSKSSFFEAFIILFFPLGEGNFIDDSSPLNSWILGEINRVKAFPIEKLNLVPICRILRFLSKKNPLLNGLTSQWIDVLACKSIDSARWPLTVGDGLRRVFGVISSGKGWNPNIRDPNTVNLLLYYYCGMTVFYQQAFFVDNIVNLLPLKSREWFSTLIGLLLFDKNPDGVCQTLSKQQRMDITTASQFLLRQMSFMVRPDTIKKYSKKIILFF